MEAAGVGNTIATRGLVWRPHCLHFCYITLVRPPVGNVSKLWTFSVRGGGAGGWWAQPHAIALKGVFFLISQKPILDEKWPLLPVSTS